MGMDRVKSHFESSAKEFDRVIQNLIPFYNEMILALISAIPFKKESVFKMIDLGCGTGTISKKIQESFPRAQITCLDISAKMLEMAKYKLGENTGYIEGNFEYFIFEDTFNLIVSSLALHHLETEEKLNDFYKKIYNALQPNGVFINIDVVLGSDDHLQEIYMQKWVEFMEKSLDAAEIQNRVLVDYAAEDRPVRLTQHVKMLGSCGFSCIDVVYKYYNFAVMLAKK